MDATQARLEVLSLALRALARTLPAEQAQEAAADLREAVDALLAEIGPRLTPEADEAIAVEVSALLGALST